MKLSDIYTKQELISNNWTFAYLVIDVKSYKKNSLGFPFNTVVKKLPLKLAHDKDAIYDMARSYVKNMFEQHQDWNPEYLTAYVSSGNDIKSCLQDIWLLNIRK